MKITATEHLQRCFCYVKIFSETCKRAKCKIVTNIVWVIAVMRQFYVIRVQHIYNNQQVEWQQQKKNGKILFWRRKNYECEMKLKSRLSCARQQKEIETWADSLLVQHKKELTLVGMAGCKASHSHVYEKFMTLRRCCRLTQFTQGQSKSGDSWFD